MEHPSQRTLAENFGYGAGTLPENSHIIDLVPNSNSLKKLSTLMGPNFGIRVFKNQAIVQTQDPNLLDTLGSQEFVERIRPAELALNF
jgi:hypothetical protein